MIRSLSPLAHCEIVLTTTHQAHLDSMAGHETGALEIVGKPYDLEVIVDAVSRGIAARHSATPRRFGQAAAT